MCENIEKLLEIADSSGETIDSQQHKSNLPIAAFVMSLIVIPLEISCLLMIHYDPSGLNSLIGGLKLLTFNGGIFVCASAFLLGCISLFLKTPSKKYAVFAIVISVLSVIMFFVALFVELMLNFPT